LDNAGVNGGKSWKGVQMCIQTLDYSTKALSYAVKFYQLQILFDNFQTVENF